MRLPLKEKGKDKDIIILINNFYNNLRDRFENAIRKNFVTFNTKVMLADFSVIDINSFDPNHIVKFFNSLEKSITSRPSNWHVVGVQSTKSDDLRRIYIQFSLEIENYY